MSCPACDSDNIDPIRGGGWRCKRCQSKWYPKEDKEKIIDAKVVTTEKILNNPSMRRFRMIDMKNRVPWDKRDILNLLKEGMKHTDIADNFGIPRTVVAKVLKESLSEGVDPDLGPKGDR